MPEWLACPSFLSLRRTRDGLNQRGQRENVLSFNENNRGSEKISAMKVSSLLIIQSFLPYAVPRILQNNSGLPVKAFLINISLKRSRGCVSVIPLHIHKPPSNYACSNCKRHADGDPDVCPAGHAYICCGPAAPVHIGPWLWGQAAP